jgi:MFS family permease
MTFGQIIATAVHTSVALLLYADQLIWQHLFIASIIQGAAWAFIVPARQSMLPELVGKRLLSNAISLNGAGFSITILIGPIIGGILYEYVGPLGSYCSVVGLCLSSLICTRLINIDKVTLQASRSVKKFWPDLMEGIRYASSNKLVLLLILIGASFVAFSFPFRMLLPAYIDLVYEKGPVELGIMSGMIGVGSFIGSISFAALGRVKRGLMLISTCFLCGMALILISNIPIYLFGILFCLMLGFGETGRRVLDQALLVDNIDPVYHGRITSLFTMTIGITPFTVIPLGLAMDNYGGQITTNIMGIGMLIFAFIILVTQKRLRNIN